jgi:hypothetical protein
VDPAGHPTVARPTNTPGAETDEELHRLAQVVVEVEAVLDRLQHGTLWTCATCGAPLDPTEAADAPVLGRCLAHGTPAGPGTDPASSGSITT